MKLVLQDKFHYNIGRGSNGQYIKPPVELMVVDCLYTWSE